MSDDDEPGSGSSLLWYEVGRSDGYSSGESDGFRDGRGKGYKAGFDAGFAEAVRQYNARDRQLEREGVRTIDIGYFNQHIHLLNQRGQRIADLEGDNNWLERALKRAEERGDEWCQRQGREQRFYSAYIDCLQTLIKAGETGKRHYPEYAELRKITREMYDVFLTKNENICRPDAMGPRISRLQTVLDP